VPLEAADRPGTELTQPYQMFRSASLSKPITSIAIMKLIVNGQLSLNDKPSVPGGILDADPYFAMANVTDTAASTTSRSEISRARRGLESRSADDTQPIAALVPGAISTAIRSIFRFTLLKPLGEPNPVSRRSMIKFLMQKGLNFTPGTAYKYSNVGFLVLGEVIEKKTGLSYENYVKQNILAPLGIYDVHLGKNLLA
jgi:CubicO group peptidase (beta-lactamase class C family)